MTHGDGPIKIRIDGRLDICLAGAVVERLREEEGGREVLIELGPGVQCDLVALSYIAEAIERRSAPVTVHGLSGHDLKILQYLGVELPPATR